MRAAIKWSIIIIVVSLLIGLGLFLFFRSKGNKETSKAEDQLHNLEQPIVESSLVSPTNFNLKKLKDHELNLKQVISLSKNKESLAGKADCRNNIVYKIGDNDTTLSKTLLAFENRVKDSGTLSEDFKMEIYNAEALLEVSVEQRDGKLTVNNNPIAEDSQPIMEPELKTFTLQDNFLTLNNVKLWPFDRDVSAVYVKYIDNNPKTVIRVIHLRSKK